MVSINICVCTCQRNKLLSDCLESIAGAQIPFNTKVHVTVVDNDPGRSANDLVSKLSESYPLELHYSVEPRRGIPCARNRAIDVTHQLECDYLVFVDDDEQVDVSWLSALYGYVCKQGGDIIVSGDVIAELPADTPLSIQGLFGSKERYTGQVLKTCATNNVIIPAFVTRDLGLRFDESHPLAGGTDTIFFVEAVARGVRIVRCVEALVYESIPSSRANLAWLMKRKYRAGITEAWRKRQKGRGSLRIMLSAALVMLVETTKAVVLAVLGLTLARNKCWLKASKSAGVFMGVLGSRVDSYKEITQ